MVRRKERLPKVVFTARRENIPSSFSPGRLSAIPLSHATPSAPVYLSEPGKGNVHAPGVRTGIACTTFARRPRPNLETGLARSVPVRPAVDGAVSARRLELPARTVRGAFPRQGGVHALQQDLHLPRLERPGRPPGAGPGRHGRH